MYVTCVSQLIKTFIKTAVPLIQPHLMLQMSSTHQQHSCDYVFALYSDSLVV